MQFAIWLLGLMCHLSALVRDTLQHRLHPRQESLVRQLSSYEIVTPLRLNDLGESLPRKAHYRRRRRSLGERHLLDAARRLHYRIDGFGERFHLNLSAHADFIAPAYTVVHLGAERNGSEAGEAGEAGDMRHCFFRGHVNGEPGQPAVFSLCTGLIGTFTTQHGEYFLEPLLSAAGEEYEEEHNKPHLLYRHQRNNSVSRGGNHTESCAASGESERPVVFESGRGSVSEELDFLRTAIDQRRADGGGGGARGKASRRRKRFLSYPRYVELMVTADAKMTRHHGRNLEHYILTIMSVVAAVYKDPSVGNLINIVIVKLIVVHNEQEGPTVSFNAATTLHNFCVWQQTQNVQNDSHPSHHDTALLITREDICRAKDKCDTLGLAELGTMCDQYRSCSISEENGISASFTIAHELGHV
ncbi:A disintegrin and metalloproteinase with thrombospondin motifs 20-like, partial [Nelusetta ayraudi]|uniref:A disintegrin and metalloproteinase with thrombospondin motifs 20-like n=1 Tax=Nelusetta ayraudi TaxID=303726 RepID=UPI003F710FA4